jgi:hypothetical protein
MVRDRYLLQYDFTQGGWKEEPLTPGKTDNILKSVIAGHDHLWLVEFGVDFWDPHIVVPYWLNAQLLWWMINILR